MNISLVINDQQLQAKLRRLANRLDNMAPVMSRIAKWYEGRVAENFRRESAPDGTPWKPLSAVTLQLGIARAGGFKKKGYVKRQGA